MRRCDYAVIGVEEGILVPAILSDPALLFRALHHHLNPMYLHRINHHVEDGGGQRVPLRHPPEAMELRPVAPPRLHDHPQPTPVCPEDPESLMPHAVAIQYLQESGPIQGAISLVQVQNYHVQDLLP